MRFCAREGGGVISANAVGVAGPVLESAHAKYQGVMEDHTRTEMSALGRLLRRVRLVVCAMLALASGDSRVIRTGLDHLLRQELDGCGLPCF